MQEGVLGRGAPPPRLFCVLGQARSGSNLLAGHLNTHPGIVCHHELFDRKAVHAAPALRAELAARAPTLLDPAARDRAPFRWLRRLVAETAALAPQAQCIGFKLFPEHGEQLLAFVCTAPEIAVVTLERADRLAQWASLQIALRTGAWVHTMGEVGDTRVRFEPTRFAAWCERLDTDARRIERLLWRKRRCHVLYEDLTGEPEARAAALARVVDTIGAGPAPLRMPTIRRQDCRPARERFSNPEAVDAALADPALRLLMRPAPRPGR